MRQHRLSALIPIFLIGLSQLAGCSAVSSGTSSAPEHTQLLVNQQHTPRSPLVVDRHVLDTQSLAFIPHTGSGKYQSYVAQTVAFEPIQALIAQVESHRGISLKHRGEAHITVLTPPEFERLSSYLSIDEINALVERDIQRSAFHIECLGMGKMVQNERELSTYFLVVRSKDLVRLRQKISDAYVHAGGAAPAFVSQYYPHITLGFTDRDLYEADGVIKNSTACVAPVTLQ